MLYHQNEFVPMVAFIPSAYIELDPLSLRELVGDISEEQFDAFYLHISTGFTRKISLQSGMYVYDCGENGKLSDSPEVSALVAIAVRTTTSSEAIFNLWGQRWCDLNIIKCNPLSFSNYALFLFFLID